MGGMVRVLVVYRRLGARRTSTGATGGSILRGGFMVSTRLPGGAASSLAVRPRVGVKRPSGLLSGLHHPLSYWQVWGADVGS